MFRRWTLNSMAILLLGFILLPLLALLLEGGPAQILHGFHHPLLVPALTLSLRTSALSMVVVVVLGTPLAWRMARSKGSWTRIVEPLVDLPIVIPPAVIGVGLLYAWGREGLLGGILGRLDLGIPFTTLAVVFAQIIVSAPFYIQSATSAFAKVDDELLLVARTLGASPSRAFFRVALPASAQGLFSGAAMSWARAMGEFGATLLFAGNLQGRTQTLPLAIFTALETDLEAARAISLVLAGLGLVILILVRSAPLLARMRRKPGGKEAPA